jgi:hypothetical protein
MLGYHFLILRPQEVVEEKEEDKREGKIEPEEGWQKEEGHGNMRNG